MPKPARFILMSTDIMCYENELQRKKSVDPEKQTSREIGNFGTLFFMQN